MNYTELLNELIERSGKTVKQIANECTANYGVNLTNTYLSGLKTTPGKQASEEINRALAKACGAEYEDILVVQAFIDRAPLPIIDALELLKAMATTKHPFEKRDEFTELTEADKDLSLAEFICKVIKTGGDLAELRKEARKEKHPNGLFISKEDLEILLRKSQEAFKNNEGVKA